MKNRIIIGILLFSFYTGFSQKNITWEDLAAVEFTEKFFPAYGENFLYPEFAGSIKSLEGKLVTITGYFLNIDPRGELQMLSKGPMASCFFCGIGGPETAVELQFKSKKSYKTDTIITVTGTLKLNSDDIEHFNYILTECTALIMK